MGATTPPKGRPTVGRRDRRVAERRSQARNRVRKIIWVAVALITLLVVLVLGTGTGGRGTGGVPQVGAVVPLLLTGRLRSISPRR